MAQMTSSFCSRLHRGGRLIATSQRRSLSDTTSHYRQFQVYASQYVSFCRRIQRWSFDGPAQTYSRSCTPWLRCFASSACGWSSNVSTCVRRFQELTPRFGILFLVCSCYCCANSECFPSSQHSKVSFSLVWRSHQVWPWMRKPYCSSHQGCPMGTRESYAFR